MYSIYGIIGERGKRHFVYANLLIWRFYKLCKMLQTETVTHTDLRTEILVNFRNQLTFHCLLLEDTVEPRFAMGNL